MKMEKLKDWLMKKYSMETAKMYERDIQHFLSQMPNAKTALYADVMQYVEGLRKTYPNPRTINRMLYGVKAYYNYLNETDQRETHPCKSLKLRDAKTKQVQLQDMFTESELESLLDRKERYEALRTRNQVIISLLIYQALKTGEIINLKTSDVDLEKGTIYIRKSRKSNARKLELKPKQIMVFYQYLHACMPDRHKVRPELLEKNQKETSQLIINLRGQEETGEGINYLVETMRHKYPGRKLNVRTIRQSVIANLLKPTSAGGRGKGLREVQYFAGHRKISSTERYRQTGLEELKTAIMKYHPLG
jgi:site-specific recombinase XerD